MLTSRSQHRRGQARLQRGLSIVELMVGVAIGLIIVAAATTIMAGQLVENRRLLMEAQIQQDLRAAADIITRDLRRSAYLAERPFPSVSSTGLPSSLQTLDSVSHINPMSPGTAVRNPYASPTNLQVTGTCPSSTLQFAYVSWTTSPPTSADVGYSLSSGVLMSLVNGSTNALTDANTMKVTEFCVVISPAVSERLPCAKLCPSTPSDPTACWPTYQIRTAKVSIKAEGRGVNANIKREVSSTVRLRNDYVNLRAIVSSAIQACPV